MLRQVRADLASANPAVALEAQVARRYWRDLVAYDRRVLYPGTAREFGQVDVELSNAIIEVTIGKGSRKVGQVRERLMSPLVNPDGKPIIVFGPRMTKPNQIRDINMAGGVVAHGQGDAGWQMLDHFIYGR